MPKPWVIKLSRSHRRRCNIYGGAEAATPNSLNFTGSPDEVVGPDIADFTGNTWTVDLYWYCPATRPAFSRDSLIGHYENGVGGWDLNTYSTPNPATVWRTEGQWYIVGPTAKQPGTALNNAFDAWFYLRWRSPNTNYTYISVNAGAEKSAFVANPGTWTYQPPSSAVLKLMNGRQGYHAGKLCYVHIWDTDKGALATVPTSPFAVDGDTIARYTFSEGAGSTLGDDSGNSYDGTITGATWSTDVPTGWTL
jgi:hypothetical protein